MGKYNMRKILALTVIASVLGTIAIGFQNFTANESAEKKAPSLNDALSAALQSAEADSTARQIALNVEPTQIEKKSLKKHRDPSAIIDGTDSLQETRTDWVPKETHLDETPEDSVADEIGDKGDQ